MKDSYYKLFADCYCKEATCLHPSLSIDERKCFDGDGKSLSHLAGTRFEFPINDEEAKFLPILVSVGIDCYLVSKQFKDVVEPYITSSSGVEFVPVKVFHRNERERLYYIMHFLRFEDVIDYANSKIVRYSDGTQTVMVPSLKLSKIRDKHIFCIDAVGNVIISNTLRRTLIKNGMKEGLSFSKSCISEHE